MSASARLRELEPQVLAIGDEVEVRRIESARCAALTAALPLIADVVEAAERVTALDFPATYIGEIDGVRHYGTSGDAARIIAPALTALRKALNGSAGEAVSSPAKKLAGSGETALNARLDDSGRLSSDSPHISNQESSRSAGDGGVT